MNGDSGSAPQQDSEVAPTISSASPEVASIEDHTDKPSTESGKATPTDGSSEQPVPKTPSPLSPQVTKDPRRFRPAIWWPAVAALLLAAIGFSSWAAADANFNHAHRLLAALAALLDVVALGALAHLLIVVYQDKAGVLKPNGVQTGGFGSLSEPGVNSEVQETLEFRRRGLKGAVMGQDGRASTSKTQVALWTGALLWALSYFLLLARTSAQAKVADFFSNAVGTSWHPEYLVLLGLPVAAAATAKAVVSASNNGQGPLPTAQPGQTARVYIRNPVLPAVKGFNAGVAELMTADDGTVAWSDLQYTAFTLVTLVYFVAQVLAQPALGLPAVPAALLTLMGVSASGYTAKKIIDTQGSAPKQLASAE